MLRPSEDIYNSLKYLCFLPKDQTRLVFEKVKRNSENQAIPGIQAIFEEFEIEFMKDRDCWCDIISEIEPPFSTSLDVDHCKWRD